MTYQDAKSHKTELESKVAAASVVLRAFPKTGPMGLTPDHVKESTVFQDARRDFDVATATLRQFNAMFMKRYKAEYASDASVHPRRANKGVA